MSGYDLSRVVETIGNNDNHDWLGGAHGTDTTDSCTLDAAAFLTAFPTGEVPAGVHMSKNPATGRYRPGFTTADTHAGFLYHAVTVKTGINPVGALFWHGSVVLAKCPLGAGAPANVAAVQANLPFIRLV